MTILRLANGSDASVKLTVEETLATLGATTDPSQFVELPGEGGPVHVRPAGVIAIFGDNRKGLAAGFRVGSAQATG
jgi:hypothetical protein